MALALGKEARDRQLVREQTVVKQRFAGLTPREREVFALVVSDRPNKEIAHQANSLPELITMAVLCDIHELHLHH